MSTIRINVPQLIQERGIIPFDLVRNAGIAPGTAYRLADANRHDEIKSITFDVLEALCRYLNVTVSDILEYEPEDENKKAGA